MRSLYCISSARGLMMRAQTFVHDYARRAEARLVDGHLLHAWLLPHATKDPRRVPHAHPPVEHPHRPLLTTLPALGVV